MTFRKTLLPLLLFLTFQLFSQSDPGYNLLWKIQGNGLKQPCYLFGTMHVRDARAFNFSDSVMLSLEKCSAFALEIHPDTMMMDVFNGILNAEKEKGNSDLKDLLSESEYNKLDEKFVDEYGYSIEKLKIKNPFVIRSMLNKAKVSNTDKATFVDAYLLGISKTLGKKICGLEKTKDQLDFFNGMSKEKLKDQYRDIINSDEERSDTYRSNLIDVYSRGNIYDIEKEVSFGSAYDSVMVKRNYTMLRSMMTIFKTNSLFTAVGVAHLPGKQGLIQLLKNEGYEVTPVGASFTGVAKKYSIDASKMKWERYKDSLNGFSIESPGAFLDLKLNPALETKFYMDLTNVISYGYYVVNNSGSATPLNEKKLIDNIIKNYRKNEKYSLGKIKHLNKDGIGIRELLVRTGENNSLRLQLFVKNNILYGLFVGGETSKMYYPETDRYFNSFVATHVEIKKDPKWITFNPPQGAFSLALPTEPKPIIKEVPVNGEPGSFYKLNMYMSTNLGTMTNYLIRYNDYPDQMYIDKKDKVFDATIQELTLTNKLASGPDTIWKDGYEGRQFALWLQNKYYTEARIYVRGNRTYFLLKQNLTENSTKMLEDHFFESFTLEPYKVTEKHTLLTEDGSFELTLPTKPLVVRDSVDSDRSSFQKTIDYYSTNPNSGGLYQFEMSELVEFVKIKNKSEYYAHFLKGLMKYSDSLISSDSVTIQGHYGREFVISKWQEDSPKRIRIWIVGNKFFYMASYGGKDELFNEESNLIFNSFKVKGSVVPFDLSASKTDKILAGLTSKDTSLYKKSMGSFAYYDFEKEDLPKLSKALLRDYADDSLNTGARTKIIGAIAETKDTLAYAALSREFYSKTNPDEIKVSALEAITQISLTKGLPLYLKLLSSGRALNPETGKWRLFSPLRDSIALTREKFEALVPLFDTSAYRSSLISLANTLASDDSTGDFTKKYFALVTKHALEDMKDYFVALEDTSSKEYHYETGDYLNFLEKANRKEIADTYTGRLLSNSRIDPYYTTRALVVRLTYQLPVPKEQVEEQLKNMDSRYSILRAYEKTGEWDKVSKKYTSEEELGKLMLYNYIIEDYNPPKDINLLGKVEVNKLFYYVYSFTFQEDETTYMGMSGPFDKMKKMRLEEIYTYSLFEAKAKDWKEQARLLLSNY